MADHRRGRGHRGYCRRVRVEPAFFRGYLIGYMLVLGFSLGSLALLMLGI